MLFSFFRIFVIELVIELRTQVNQVKYLLIRYENLLPLVFCVILYLFFFIESIHCSVTEEQAKMIHSTMTVSPSGGGQLVIDEGHRYMLDPTLKEDMEFARTLVVGQPIIPQSFFNSLFPVETIVNPKTDLVSKYLLKIWEPVITDHEKWNELLYFTDQKFDCLTINQKNAYLNYIAAGQRLSDRLNIIKTESISVKKFVEHVILRDLEHYNTCREAFLIELSPMISGKSLENIPDDIYVHRNLAVEKKLEPKVTSTRGISWKGVLVVGGTLLLGATLIVGKILLESIVA